jgi:hypothetical protein
MQRVPVSVRIIAEGERERVLYAPAIERDEWLPQLYQILIRDLSDKFLE